MFIQPWFYRFFLSPGYGRDSISIKDLMEKIHQLPISIMTKERRLRWLGMQLIVRAIIWSFFFATRVPGTGCSTRQNDRCQNIVQLCYGMVGGTVVPHGARLLANLFSAFHFFLPGTYANIRQTEDAACFPAVSCDHHAPFDDVFIVNLLIPVFMKQFWFYVSCLVLNWPSGHVWRYAP